MKVNVFIILLGLLHFVYAAPTINTNAENSYLQNQHIIVYIEDIENHPNNWVGIYKKEANNEWKNVQDWAWTNGKDKDILRFTKPLPIGEYEVRLFYKNSYKVEAKKAFKIIPKTDFNPYITTNGTVYKEDEPIKVNLVNMLGHPQDWLGIYKRSDNNEWKNVQDWAWTNGQKEGSVTFKNLLAPGDYEVRAFFQNSFKEEGKDSFTVRPKESNGANVATTQRWIVPENDISIDFSNMSGNAKDWIAIYKADASNAWENVLSWKFTGGDKEDTHFRLFKTNFFAPGNYEVRAFFNNSFKLEARFPFTIYDYPQQILLENKSQHRYAKGVMFNEDKTRAYVYFSKQNENFTPNPYYNKHVGLSLVNNEDKKNPKVIAHTPDFMFQTDKERSNIIFSQNEKFLVFFNVLPGYKHTFFTLNPTTLKKVGELETEFQQGPHASGINRLKDTNIIKAYASGDFTAITHYHVSDNGSIAKLPIESGILFGYDGLHMGDSRLLENNRLEVSYSFRSNSNGDLPTRLKVDIYDISNLPNIELLYTETSILPH